MCCNCAGHRVTPCPRPGNGLVICLRCKHSVVCMRNPKTGLDPKGAHHQTCLLCGCRVVASSAYRHNCSADARLKSNRRTLTFPVRSGAAEFTAVGLTAGRINGLSPYSFTECQRVPIGKFRRWCRACDDTDVPDQQQSSKA